MRPFTLLLLALLCVPAARARADENVVPVGFFDGAGGLLERLNPFRKSEGSGPAAAPRGAPMTIVSWNLQTFGQGLTKKHLNRKQAFDQAMPQVLADPSVGVLAAQEVANDKGAATLQEMLPQSGDWQQSFQQTDDSMNNGFWVRDTKIDCQGLLFEDRGLSQHPARVAHMRRGDFDFTIITVHLSFDGGHADSSGGELDHVLDWLQAYFAKPGADPDVIVVGDFNLPSRAGRSKGKGIAVEDFIDQWRAGGHRLPEFVTLVDKPTSRSHGDPAHNYDHFLLSKHLAQTAYVDGSADRVPDAVIEAIRAIEAQKSVLISDHFPVQARFYTSGAGADGRPIQPDGAPICSL